MLLYQGAIKAYQIGISVAATFNDKAKAWIQGRRHLTSQVAAARSAASQAPVLFHCASLGEFEQAVPVMDQMHQDQPQTPIWVTFFSPSGYQNAKLPHYVSFHCYLPADLPRATKQFVATAQPKAFITVKYEIWPQLFSQLQRHQVPIGIISAHFRPKQIYFKSYGCFFLRALNKAQAIALQYPIAKDISNQIQAPQKVCGDTRFNRVLQTAQQPWTNQSLEQFVGEHECLILASCWEPEVALLCDWLRCNPESAPKKIILAPHDVSSGNIARLEKALQGVSCSFMRFSSAKTDTKAQALIIDSVGILKYAFRYAHLAFVGGGFRNKLHNILEPMAYQIPVVFGPNSNKYPEAAYAIQQGSANAVSKWQHLQALWLDKIQRKQMAQAAKELVLENQDAAEKTYRFIQPLLQ